MDDILTVDSEIVMVCYIGFDMLQCDIYGIFFIVKSKKIGDFFNGKIVGHLIIIDGPYIASNFDHPFFFLGGFVRQFAVIRQIGSVKSFIFFDSQIEQVFFDRFEQIVNSILFECFDGIFVVSCGKDDGFLDIYMSEYFKAGAVRKVNVYKYKVIIGIS